MYHLFKQSRIYNGKPYCGYSSNGKPAEAETLEEAKNLQKKLNDFNPVGWNIFDAETGDLVDGVEYF